MASVTQDSVASANGPDLPEPPAKERKVVAEVALAGEVNGPGLGLDLAKVREIAVAAVLEAAQVTSKVQKELTDEDTVLKKDRSPVTIADLGAQAVVIHRVSTAFAGIPVIGEEDAGDLRENADMTSRVLAYVQQVVPEIDEQELLACIDRGKHAGGPGLFWVLDPIDGTKGFLRREQYAICLGLIQDGNVLVSVLGCPNLNIDPDKPNGERGCLFIGVSGKGATQYDIATGVEKPIHVSSVTDTSEASFVESVESGHSNHSRNGDLAKQLNITRASTRMDSQCKFGVVARGESTLYLRLAARAGDDQKIWDIAAGAMIVEEAGGRVSDATGSKLNYMNGRTIGVGDLFASNGHLHDEVLDALRQQPPCLEAKPRSGDGVK